MGTLAQAIDSGRFREGEGPNVQHILRTVRHISQAGSPKGQAVRCLKPAAVATTTALTRAGVTLSDALQEPLMPLRVCTRPCPRR